MSLTYEKVVRAYDLLNAMTCPVVREMLNDKRIDDYRLFLEAIELVNNRLKNVKETKAREFFPKTDSSSSGVIT
jgi:hypothetical protein